ncbi:MAG: hypothetical protein R3F17_03885 [Planctomycetota bacterium]
MLNTVEDDNTNSSLLAILMAATVILTVVTVLVTIALFYWKRDQIASSYVQTAPAVGKEQLGEQQQKLEESRWIDKDAGKTSIPIERAKELLIQEGVK